VIGEHLDCKVPRYLRLSLARKSPATTQLNLPAPQLNPQSLMYTPSPNRCPSLTPTKGHTHIHLQTPLSQDGFSLASVNKQPAVELSPSTLQSPPCLVTHSPSFTPKSSSVVMHRSCHPRYRQLGSLCTLASVHTVMQNGPTMHRPVPRIMVEAAEEQSHDVESSHSKSPCPELQ
jgi:hypothetical protein